MDYSKFNISRRQAQQVAFSIISEIESYVANHSTEYEEFLRAEELRERGEEKIAD